MSTDVERLQREVEVAERKAASARQKAEQAAVVEAQRRAERERRWDELMLDLHDEVALDKAVAEAEHRLEEALANDPLVTAAVDLRRAKMRRRLADELRAGIASRLHGTPPTYALPPTDVVVGGTVERYVERRGSELAHEEVEQWWTRREQAASE